MAKEILIRESDLKNLDIFSPREMSNGQVICSVCNSWKYNCYRLKIDINICQKCFGSARTAMKHLMGEKTLFHQLERRSMARHQRRKGTEEKQMNNLLVKAKPYIDLGLPEEFALSCAKSPETSDSVLDLWEATWWKQYEPEDPMITSVLNGQFTEEQAKWMNTFRSDHPDLVWALLNKSVTVEWATALLDSGFRGHIDEVSAALAGATPKIIARISKIHIIVADQIPPSLDAPANTHKPEFSSIIDSWKPESTLDSNDLSLHIPEIEKIIDSYSTTDAKNVVKALGLRGIKKPKTTLKNAVNMTSDFNEGVSLPKNKGDWEYLAGNMNISGRSNLTSKQLKKLVKNTCRKTSDWAIKLLEEEETS